MVEYVQPLFEEPGVTEELTLVGVVLRPHVLDVCEVLVEIPFDHLRGRCGWGVGRHEGFGECVQALVVFVFEA